MEFLTVRQVSQDYGISARMLRYYEQIGLLESKRIDDYAYRVYDEAAVKTLQQIVILRKLQIPMKQIREILNNQDAVSVIEVFKQNINELDEKITALSTVKTILSRFVEELQEKANVRLKYDLLSDTTMLAVVNALSFPENRIKENVSMESLNKANEQFNKISEKNVRIIYHLPSTVACLKYYNGNASNETNKARIEAEAIVNKFVKDTNLYQLKPDFKLFGFGDKNDTGVWEMWITIPDDFTVVAPFEKTKFLGGLYASCTDHDFDLGNWINDSDEYEWDQVRWVYDIEEYFNPFNIYGLENIESESNIAMYTAVLYPIKEIPKLSNEEKERISTSLSNIKNNAIHGNAVEIDLTSMTKKSDSDKYYSNFVDGFMIMHMGGENKSGGMITSETFTSPVKIDLRAKTDKAYISIEYAGISISLRWKSIPMYGDDALLWVDNKYGEWQVYKKHGKLPVDEFVDIEVIFNNDAFILKVNGELKHYNSEYGYIKTFRDNPEYILSGAVYLSTEGGSTVTVESLRVTEL